MDKLDLIDIIGTEEIDVDRNNLTKYQIQKLDTSSLLKISESLGIQDFQNADDLKLQVILEIMKKTETTINPEFYSAKVKALKESSVEEDKLRRMYLTKYIKKIENIYMKIQNLSKVKMPSSVIDVESVDDPLKSRIKNEFQNFEKEFAKIKENIQNYSNCALLICGDSGSGKSSFINLLVNRNILPVSIRNNTACQVRLTYGTHEYAELVDLQGNKRIINKDKFKTELKNCLEKITERTEISCRSAVIYLNSPILEGGLDIYDTIGLGESDYYNEQLLKDLENISCVLFLIKKNNPIGDNTVGGLSKIINYIANNNVPSSSMHFIINMCDQLDKFEDINELKKNVKTQIRERCSGLNPEVTTFSTKQELYFQSKDFISKDYRSLMELIESFHINSINTKTVLIFEFLNLFIWKSIDCIIESEQFTEDSKAKKSEYIGKLRKLEENHKFSNASYKRIIERLLTKLYSDYSNEIKRFFNQEMKKRITKKVTLDLQIIGMFTLDEIDHKIMELTNVVILDEFKIYVKEKKLWNKCCERMLKELLSQFANHQKKIEEYNRILTSNIDSTLIDIESDIKLTNFNDLLGLPREKRKLLAIFAPVMIPIIQLKNIAQKEIENVFSFISMPINRKSILSFHRNPTPYVTKKSSQFYKNFSSKHVKTIMDSLFYVLRQVTMNFDTYLDKHFRYLAKNISLLEEDMRNKEIVSQTYIDIKTSLENIREDFCKFYLLHFRKDKYHIMDNQIKLDLKTENDINPEPILINRNRIVYNGHFKGDQQMDSSILVYKNVDKKTMKDLYLEYIKHKKLFQLHSKKGDLTSLKNFMNIRFHILISINNKFDLYPKFIVNGIDCSLKKLIDEIRPELKPETCLYNKISGLVKQILNGLSYIHQQKPPLNHYDLKIDSIGYNNIQNTIKLSSISFETTVHINYDLSTYGYVIEMSHLPLKILEINSNVKYTCQTDIYCLGTILYYLWIGVLPLFDVIYNKQILTIFELVQLLKKSKIQSYAFKDCFQNEHGLAMLKACKTCWKDDAKIEELNFLF